MRDNILEKVRTLAEHFDGSPGPLDPDGEAIMLREWFQETDFEHFDQDASVIEQVAFALGYLQGCADCGNQTLLELLVAFDLDPDNLNPEQAP